MKLRNAFLILFCNSSYDDDDDDNDDDNNEIQVKINKILRR